MNSDRIEKKSEHGEVWTETSKGLPFQFASQCNAPCLTLLRHDHHPFPRFGKRKPFWEHGSTCFCFVSQHAENQRKSSQKKTHESNSNSVWWYRILHLSLAVPILVVATFRKANGGLYTGVAAKTNRKRTADAEQSNCLPFGFFGGPSSDILWNSFLRNRIHGAGKNIPNYNKVANSKINIVL
jgi:hypothetical protein